MSNLLDYLRWRGDLPMTAVPLGGVDGLILAQLSMLRWENALREGESAPLEALAPAMATKPVSEGFTAENDEKLLALAAPSRRFGGVTVGDYVNTVDDDSTMQFAAVALRLPDGTTFAAFRGTDSTLTGWKEDCNMAFSKPVPAQEAAAEYLNALARRYPGGLRVGGHSKGGNLAMYAASHMEDAARERLLAVYNYDGPGLSDRMDAPALYARVTGRLHSYVPQGSVVGMLLAHPDEYTVVKSNSVSIWQHDPYSWQVEGPDFVTLAELSRDSARFDLTFRQWLAGLDEDDRALLVNRVFDVLCATNSRSFGREFWAGLARNPKSVFAAIQGVDPEVRRRIAKMMLDLGALALKPQ